MKYDCMYYLNDRKEFKKFLDYTEEFTDAGDGFEMIYFLKEHGITHTPSKPTGTLFYEWLQEIAQGIIKENIKGK